LIIKLRPYKITPLIPECSYRLKVSEFEMMRVLAFISAVMLCLLYGLVFDFVANNMIENIICESMGTAFCFIPLQLDHFLSVITLMLILPVSSFLLINWFINKPKLMKSTSMVGLLFGAPY